MSGSASISVLVALYEDIFNCDFILSVTLKSFLILISRSQKRGPVKPVYVYGADRGVKTGGSVKQLVFNQRVDVGLETAGLQDM